MAVLSDIVNGPNITLVLQVTDITSQAAEEGGKTELTATLTDGSTFSQVPHFTLARHSLTARLFEL